MEKAAQVREDAGSYVVCRETRQAFAAAVDRHLAPVALSKADCVPWRKRMPETGLMPFS